ncbi:MAG: M23 family metallopeptidase [Leptospiraceae bacterium]|nr:M23 family metallopeptidase [Leptospiraceae bacterium]
MKLKSALCFLLAGASITQLQAEILNFRKLKLKEEKQSTNVSIADIESKKLTPLSFIPVTPEYKTDSIPKPNTPPVLEKEKIIIPLPSPSDPAKPQAKQSSQFSRPYNQNLIKTVNFSLTPDNPHKGVVFSPMEIGSVISSMEGRVVAIDFMDGYYNYVIIEHMNGYFTVYGNLDEVYVAEGQTIKKGEALGNLVKEKGLYFQVNQGKKILDPISLIKS